MKKIFFLVLVLIPILYSCDKDTEGISKITYYVDLSLKGSSIEVIPVGGVYNEPGFVATENGSDVAANVKVVGNVNPAIVGAYSLTYSAINKDGFPKSVTRLVLVVPKNLGTKDLSGVYGGQRTGRAYSSAACNITKIADGVFLADDFFGGFYNIVRQLGPSYRLETYFVLKDDNTIESLTNNSPWGPWAVLNGVYDTVTGKITHTVEQDGFEFDVTLVKE